MDIRLRGYPLFGVLSLQRVIWVLEVFRTLDGVIQAGGEPEEDIS